MVTDGYSLGKFYVNFGNVVQFFIQSLLSKIGNLNKKNPKKLKPLENNLHVESDSSNGKLYDCCSDAAYTKKLFRYTNLMRELKTI